MASSLQISSVKRERAKKEAIRKRKMEMRAALPVLTKEQIRRYRLTYHDALVLDLAEQGYKNAATYISKLVEYQEELRDDHGPDSKIWNRPRLMHSKEELDRLFHVLRTAESAHFDGKVGNEIDEFLKLAVYYTKGSQDWWWLAEQLLLSAIIMSEEYPGDGRKRYAISKFLYGKYLLENVNEYLRAKVYFQESRDISMGKAWTIRNELGDDAKGTVYTASCVLLYKSMVEEIKVLLYSDPNQGARQCTIARRRAIDACDHEGEAQILMLNGMCHMNDRNAKAATAAFERALRIFLRTGNKKGICEARIQLALAYLQTQRSEEALEQLETLHKFAEENNFAYYEAKAHRCFGEFYLNEGKPNLATPFLVKALHTFHSLNELVEREQARNLAAISAGQELMPKYAELLLKCGVKDLQAWRNLMKLIMWKDTRELFWSDSNTNLLSNAGSVGTFVGALSRERESKSTSTDSLSHHISEKSLTEQSYSDA